MVELECVLIVQGSQEKKTSRDCQVSLTPYVEMNVDVEEESFTLSVQQCLQCQEWKELEPSVWALQT